MMKKHFKITTFNHLLKCPLCEAALNYKDRSFICVNNHSYDLAKTGYVNLLQQTIKTDYDKSLFKSRHIVNTTHLYEPMISYITNVITKHFNNTDKKQPHLMLDVGCGEGSHLHHLIHHLSLHHFLFEGIGLDIAKDGIQLASKTYPEQTFIVGDLAQNPFFDQSFDVLLNVFSPSNYNEFKRLLKPRGIVIKVVPGPHYLKELRSFFHAETKNETYSNDDVTSHFSHHFSSVHHHDLHYTFPLSTDELSHLVEMTPLTWQTTDEQKADFLKLNVPFITIDLSILIGQL